LYLGLGSVLGSFAEGTFSTTSAYWLRTWTHRNDAYLGSMTAVLYSKTIKLKFWTIVTNSNTKV
jgi:hypothetical protein